MSPHLGQCLLRFERLRSFRAVFPAVVLGLLVLSAGCGRSEVDAPRAVAAEVPAGGQSQEIWDSLYLQNAKVGYSRTRIHPAQRSGQKVLETESLTRLTISRFGQRSEQEMTASTVETPDGKLLEFKTEVNFGTSPMVVTGRAEGSHLKLETETAGKRVSSQIPWSDDIRGFRAVEQSLETAPLKAGERRKLKMLMPLVNQVAEVELIAGQQEPTSVLGIKTTLLRIENLVRLPDGQTMNSTVWTDAQGQTIKTHIEALNNESFRTTRELAMAAPGTEATFDLGWDLIVPVQPPLANALRTREARYRVELAHDDPAKVFSAGNTQTVRALDPHTAEITVRSVRPAELRPPATPAKPVAGEYLAANSILQIEDPRIRALAREAKGSATAPADVAVALEAFVHRTMSKKNFSQAFATAAEVAESREGDCSEHAVLLAALARACGIPSRAAIGLVYVEHDGGFGYHMWTEMYLEGQWVPLDATLGQGGIGAAHLKLTDTSLVGAAAYSSFLPVVQVVGQLKIQVLRAE